jgi:hypothetical protein
LIHRCHREVGVGELVVSITGVRTTVKCSKYAG